MKDLATIKEIYHAALEVPMPEREAFLREACGDNAELFQEIESLLSFDEQAEDFIETPPADLAAAFFTKQKSVNLLGKKLIHYQILELLGAGGMGEVYLAEDTKLKRKVALKILPAHLSQDAERKIRFEREAHAVSALNHPNIITIYGIEEAEELSFIVTELVDGKTLRARISEASLTPQETIEIGIQIAGALASAHAVGIIHRDIKPANIMIRPDGLVKVLDFGLVKLIETNSQKPEAAISEVESNEKGIIIDGKIEKKIEATGFIGTRATRESLLPRSTSQHHTNHGSIMGTLNYMSPEQALGQPIDARSDIFSLGVVLYEMLLGLQPFAGASDADIYEATLNKTPESLRRLNAKIPFELERIINRALTKDRTRRQQSVSELQLDLQKLKQSAKNDESFFRLKAKFAGMLIPSLVLVLLAILAGGYFAFFYHLANVSDTPKIADFKQLTSGNGEVLPSLSPDGKTIIFTSYSNGNRDIYLQRVGEPNAVNLTKNSVDDAEAAFSPNGKEIAFHSDRDGGGLFVMDVNGENIHRVTDGGFYPAWSPDGKEIAFSSHDFSSPTDRFFSPISLWVVNLATGEKRELTEGDAVQPSWSPNGERIAFWGINSGGVRDVKTISRNGGEAVAVTDDTFLDWNPVWSPDGKYLYFDSNRGGSMNFWRVPIEQTSGKTLGNPEPFTTPSVYSGHLTFSADGKTFAYVQTTTSSSIFQTEFNARTETITEKMTELTHSGRIDRNPWVSPDSEWIAFDAIKDKQEDVFVMRRDGSELRQLTNDINNDRCPRWSPDGKKIVFYSDRSGKYESWTINPDGSGLAQMTFNSEMTGFLTFWSPDGKKILQNQSQSAPRIFNAEETLAGQTPFQIPVNVDGGDWLMAFSWSPNGEKIATLRYRKKNDMGGIAVYTLATNNLEELVEFGKTPVWLNDNRRLVFLEKNKVHLLDTVTRKTKELLVLPPGQELYSIAVSPDSHFIYLPIQKKESNIWTATAEGN